jgi:hypothetical protein
MLRLVLLLLYLITSSSFPTPQFKQGGSADPLGLNSPPAADTDQGGSADPLG